MSVRSALRGSVRVVRNAPALVGIAAAFVVLWTVPWIASSFAGSTILALLGMVWTFGVAVVVMPFVVAGGLEMAWSALDGRATFEDFVEGARDNYLPMLGFALVAGAIHFAWSSVVGTVAYFVYVIGLVALGGALFAGVLSADALVVGGVVALFTVAFSYVVYVVVSAPVLVLQFVPGAYAFEDRAFVDGFERGLALVGRNPGSVAAFDLVLLTGQYAFVVLWWAMFAGSAVGVFGVGTSVDAPGLSILLDALGSVGLGWIPWAVTLICVSVVAFTGQAVFSAAIYTPYYEAIAGEA